jgi:magnesium chelatase family protein
VQVYRARLSGPLLDRIDMHVEVPAVTARDLLCSHSLHDRTTRDAIGSPRQPGGRHHSTPSVDNSAIIRHRVADARAIQQNRFVQCASVRSNADMGLVELDVFCRLDLESAAILQKAAESFSLSARAAHRCLRVARTIADLVGAKDIALKHIAEAVQYQVLERRG